MKRLFVYPEVYLGHDLMMYVSWLSQLKRHELDEESLQEIESYLEEVKVLTRDKGIRPYELYRQKEWAEWVDEVVGFGEYLEEADIFTDSPPRPPCYNTEILFEAVLGDFRKKRTPPEEDVDPAFAEFS